MPVLKGTAKKDRLTLTQLTSYDDILTDALVDHVYFWTNIRKNKNAYHSSRGIREEDVTNILQKSVIVEKDVASAEVQLLALPGLRKYLENLKTEKEKDDFRKHLKKYISIYLPDCPFEVSTTNRYTIDTHEAAVTARREIRKGEVVKYLCGIQVIMTPEEEELIKRTRRDFSIVVSSRNRAASLFLGPARFANHDCGANAKLMTTGNAGMTIIAVQDIDVGEEITVSYGENYFGEDNCECLCRTCEENCQNGWSQTDEEGESGHDSIPKLSIEVVPEGPASYSLRRRRRRDSSGDSSRDNSETPDVIIRPQVLKRTPRSFSRFKHVESPLGKSASVEPGLNGKKRKREAELADAGSPSRVSPASEPHRSSIKHQKVAEPMIEETSSRESPSIEPLRSPTKCIREAKTVEEIVPYGEVSASVIAISPFVRQRSADMPYISPYSSPYPKKVKTEAPVKIEDSNMSFSESISTIGVSPTSSTSASRRGSVSTQGDGHTSTDATSVDEDTIIVEEPPVVTNAIPKARKPKGRKQSSPLKQAEAGETILVENTTAPHHPAVEDDSSVLSEIDSVIFQDIETTPKAGRKANPRSRKQKAEEPATTTENNRGRKKKRPSIESEESDDEDKPSVRRIPGDYVLTPALLAHPTSAWINCKICEEPFVQEDAYFTRSSCPRCERHSKLYGYMWPKTDKEGRNDTEERILDHRTVHRFIRPEEERLVRKRNRSVTESRNGTRDISEAVSVIKEAEPEIKKRGGRKTKRDRFTL
ncbi:hypothetical protein BGZ60DRAFT_469407 [Tricladium varicosporioides]|nr:hypothetical protein BGZ60DRAFT_469407 [Hymenoscyphus varicosporioides]